MSKKSDLLKLIENGASDEELASFFDTLSNEDSCDIILSLSENKALEERIKSIENRIEDKKILFILNYEKPRLVKKFSFIKDVLKNNFEVMYDFTALDQEFVSYVKKNDINLIITEEENANQEFVDDICLFNENIRVMLIGDSSYKVLSSYGYHSDGNYHTDSELLEAINNIEIKDTKALDKLLSNGKGYIRFYCSKKLQKNIDRKIIRIKFNEELFTHQEINKLIGVCKYLLKNTKTYKDKNVLFENTNEFYKEVEVEKVDSKFKLISKKYNDLHKKISEYVVGQDSAVEKVIKGLYEAELDAPTVEDGKPLASFFFFGPPGTGKTFLADKMAELLSYNCKKFHMEEYAMKGDEISLIGSDRQFKNATPGELNEFISDQKDKHIIIFDEIEKANQEVLNVMLTMLSKGTIHDMYYEKEVHLNNTILIFTSNVGRELYNDTSINFSNIEMPTLLDALRIEKDSEGICKFSPEFCSRIMSSNVVTFNHLNVCALNSIISNDYKKLKEDIKKTHNIKLHIDSRIPLLSIYHSGKSDARITKKYALSLIKNEIFEIGKQSDSVDLNKITNIVYNVDFSNIDKEIKDLFIQSRKVKLGVIGDRKISSLFEKNAKEYEIVQIKNIDELNSSLKKDVFAYFIDPFFGGIKNNTLSITDYNTDGINFMYRINETNSDVPIYVLSKNGEISDSDKFSLIHDGARRIVDIDDKNDFRADVLDIIEENYLQNKVDEISQKGWIVDFKTKQELSKNGNKVEITLCDFRKYMAYDSAARDLMIKQSDIPEDRFDDVIDCKEAKEELKYYIDYLKNPVEFVMSGAKSPKGILLFGPPGTGKTMLARAVAGEAGVNFINIAAADLTTDSRETGERKIRYLFARARKYAPTIIFIDEIDAIGKKRTGIASDAVLTALLTEMDGFNKSTKRPVFVLAATNYGSNSRNNEIAELDQALIRRFDSSIYVGLPDKEGREKYINLYLKKKNIDGIKKGTINTLANCTVNQSLAILENILELAFRNSRRKNKQIDDNELLNALDQYNDGEIKEVNPIQMAKIAVHEAGHTYVSCLCDKIPAYVTIESRGSYGGYVASEDEESFEKTKDELLDMIKIALAGRAAQEVVLGKQEALNTGASSDLQKASSIALNILCSFGMEDKLLTLSVNDIMSSPLADKYLLKANDILEEQYSIVKKVLKKNRKDIRQLSELLLEKGHLTKDEIIELFDLYKKDN